jgi:PIN domain nuclease of toxin-antitoxin system
VGCVEVIVIDTHILVWWADGLRSQLSTPARRAIVDADVVAFSAVTAWEIGTLARRGRINIHLGTGDWLREAMEVHALVTLPVTAEIAVRAAEFHEVLRDPIDCLIAATALTHNAPLITKDDRIRQSEVVQTIW